MDLSRIVLHNFLKSITLKALHSSAEKGKHKDSEKKILLFFIPGSCLKYIFVFIWHLPSLQNIMRGEALNEHRD